MQIVVNGEPRDVAEGTTVADVVRDLKLEPRHVAVEVNFRLVPRTHHHETKLSHGDRLEVVTLVGGG